MWVVPLRVKELLCMVDHSPSSNIKAKQKQGTTSTAIYAQTELDLTTVA
jgi:hypothetical protein